MNEFTAGSCIRFGWETFKKRPGFFIAATILFIFISWLVGSIQKLSQFGLTHFTFLIISIGLAFLLDIGIRAFAIKAHDNVQAVKLEDLWHPESYFQYLIAVVLTGIVVVIGLILLIIPGIILVLMLAFVKLSVIDKKLGPIEAMRESMRITKGHRWELLALLLLLLLLNIVGAICLFIGLLVTIPITMIAMVHAYRTLEQLAGPAPAA